MMKVKRNKLRRRDQQDIDEDIEAADNDEFEAEMRAVASMRQEQDQLVASNEGDEVSTLRIEKTYNKNGLMMANESYSIRNLPFVETFEICSYELAEHDENDDLEREMAFYNQTILAVQDGMKKLDAAGYPTRRPTDFFCEQVKSDNHMNRIKDRLLLEEKKIGAFEKRKQQEISRKYEKEMSQSKKKLKESSNDDNDTERPSKFARKEDGGRDKAGAGGKGADRRDSSTPSKRKLIMGKKYGSGVKEKMRAKLGDKKSLNDMSEFNPKGGKSVRRGEDKAGDRGKYGGRNKEYKGKGGSTGSPGAKKKSKPNRPGKTSRMQKRSTKR